MGNLLQVVQMCELTCAENATQHFPLNLTDEQLHNLPECRTILCHIQGSVKKGLGQSELF